MLLKLQHNIQSIPCNNMNPPNPFLISFLLPSWRAVRSLRPHLEERDSIWGDDWSSDGLLAKVFLEFSSAVRQMPGDRFTAPRIISLSPLSLATDVTDATLGASGLWLGTQAGAGGTATLAWSFLAAAYGSMNAKKEKKYLIMRGIELIRLRIGIARDPL